MRFYIPRQQYHNGVSYVTLPRRVIVLWDIENVRALREDHQVANSAFATMLRMFFMKTFDVSANSFQIFACCHMLRSDTPSMSEKTIDDFTPHGIIVTVMPKKKEGQADLAIKYHLSTFYDMFPGSSSEDRVVVIMSSDSDFEQDAREAKLKGCHVVVIYIPSQMSTQFLKDCATLGIHTWNWFEVLEVILQRPISEVDLFQYGSGSGMRATVPPGKGAAMPYTRQPVKPGQRVMPPTGQSMKPVEHMIPPAGQAMISQAGSSSIEGKKPPVKFVFDQDGTLVDILYGIAQCNITEKVLSNRAKNPGPTEDMRPVQENPIKNWQAFYFPNPSDSKKANTLFFRHILPTGFEWYKFKDDQPSCRNSPATNNNAGPMPMDAPHIAPPSASYSTVAAATPTWPPFQPPPPYSTFDFATTHPQYAYARGGTVATGNVFGSKGANKK